MIASGLALCLVALIVWSVARSPAFEWGTVGRYLFHPAILRGLGITIVLTVIIMLCAIVLGTVVALMRLSSSRVLSGLARAYVWFFRGVPALIQLIFWFNLALIVPVIALDVPGIGMVFSVRTNDLVSPFAAAIIALSFCEAGYIAEIVRSGIRSIPHGQLEAARSLGLSYHQIFQHIVFPQAMRLVIPPIGNEAISLLKMTSLVTYVAVNDLFYAAQGIYSRTFETIPLLIVVAVWYLVLVSIMSAGQRQLERHYGRAST